MFVPGGGSLQARTGRGAHPRAEETNLVISVYSDKGSATVYRDGSPKSVKDAKVEAAKDAKVEAAKDEEFLFRCTALWE